MTSLHDDTDNGEAIEEGPLPETIGFRFAMIPEALVYDGAVSDGAVRLFAALLRHGMDPKSCYPSNERLCELLGKTERTVQRLKSELQAAGWIEVVTRHRPDGGRTSNGYRLYSSPYGRGGDKNDGPAKDGGASPVRNGGGGDARNGGEKRAITNESQKNENPPVVPPEGGQADGQLFEPPKPSHKAKRKRSREMDPWMLQAFEKFWNRYRVMTGKGGVGQKGGARTAYALVVECYADVAEIERQLTNYQAARDLYTARTGEPCYLMAAPKFLKTGREDFDHEWILEEVEARWSAGRPLTRIDPVDSVSPPPIVKRHDDLWAQWSRADRPTRQRLLDTAQRRTLEQVA